MHVFSFRRRPGWRARWLTGFLVALVALPVLTAASADAVTPPWTIQQTQNPNPGAFNALVGVSCPSANRCVATGDDSDGQSHFSPLTETWNGTIWQVASLVKGDPLGSVTDPGFGADSCPVTTKCEIIGNFFDASGNPHPLAAVWNGFLGKASVASQPVPLPPGASAGHLRGVSCTSANNCIAVGDFATAAGGGGTLAERWDGSRWQIQPSGTTPGEFDAVSCTSATFCMAVGDNAGAALAYVYNGSTWSFSLDSAINGVRDNQLIGVSCTGDGACMAVGQFFAPGASRALSLQWVRGQWTLLNTVEPSQTVNALNGVSCTSAGNCLADGFFQDIKGQQDAMAEFWDGSNWSFEGLPTPGSFPFLGGVSCSSPGVCTTVGYFNAGAQFTFHTLAYRFVSAGSPHGFSLTRNGTVLALLRQPRTLELLVFQRGRHGHLLGAVSLGGHPRGLSRIRWNLRVGGRKLSAGSYTAELVAAFGRGVTSSGPSVTFDLTRAGAVRVRSATCSVAAAERGRC